MPTFGPAYRNPGTTPFPEWGLCHLHREGGGIRSRDCGVDRGVVKNIGLDNLRDIDRFRPPPNTAGVAYGKAHRCRRTPCCSRSSPSSLGTIFGFIGRHFVGLLLQSGATNRRRVLLPIPFALTELQAGLLELLSNPPLTRDQVRLLKTDKVDGGIEPALGDLGVQPRLLEEFLAACKDKYS